MPELLRKGKVKEVYSTEDPDVLEFYFTNQISVFDKVIPTLVPSKGETLCRTSANWFKVAAEMGLSTHFLELNAPDKMLVKRVDVIPDYSKLSLSTVNYLVPLEFIIRHYVAGSMFDRLQSGEVNPQVLGFRSDYQPKMGERLVKPYCEVTTKLEKVDRPLTKEEALQISGLTPGEWNTIWYDLLRLDDRINEEVAKRGLIHVDGKKEVAMDAKRRPMVVDTFGTADEDRFWDAEAYAQGRLVDVSKEFVRQHYKQTGYHSQLTEARKTGSPEPPIPPLPADIIPQVSELYIGLFQRLTGESFR